MEDNMTEREMVLSDMEDYCQSAIDNITQFDRKPNDLENSFYDEFELLSEDNKTCIYRLKIPGMKLNNYFTVILDLENMVLTSKDEEEDIVLLSLKIINRNEEKINTKEKDN